MNDAEAHGVGTSLLLYGNDNCGNPLEVIPGVFTPGTTTVTIWVSNEFIRVVTSSGIDQYRCQNNCLYALNGQPDPASNGPNEDIYIALNRVVAGDRFGTGICRANIRWVCPCKKKDWMDFVNPTTTIPGNTVYEQASDSPGRGVSNP